MVNVVISNELVTNDDIKFYFKLNLKVGLVTANEVKAWADEKILENSSDELALDLCFLDSEIKIKDYFNKMVEAYLVANESKIATRILQEYTLRKTPSNIEADLIQYLADIELISWYINDLDLTCLLSVYGSQIDLAYSGVLTMTVAETFEQYEQHLNEWLKQMI